MFRPPSLLATQVAPTATTHAVGQPWLLRPSTVEIVTSLHVEYASRLNRAIDGRGLSPHKIRSLVGCSPNAKRTASCPDASFHIHSKPQPGSDAVERVVRLRL